VVKFEELSLSKRWMAIERKRKRVLRRFLRQNTDEYRLHEDGLKEKIIQ